MEGNNSEQKKRTIKDLIKVSWSFVWEVAKIVIVASLIVLPIRYYLFQPFIVKGESMVPNFSSGDYLIIDEISYRLNSPERGDVVVFKYPLDASQRFIKRIIGLPGETIEIKDSKVTISQNDKNFALNEKDYLTDLSGTGGDIRISLGTNEYFVLGDNREFSYDSRRWGVLPKEDIIGKVFLRVFPAAAFSRIINPTYE